MKAAQEIREYLLQELEKPGFNDTVLQVVVENATIATTMLGQVSPEQLRDVTPYRSA